MNDDNSWIDDVIKQHKKQLKDLKKFKSSIDTDIPQITKTPSLNHSQFSPKNFSYHPNQTFTPLSSHQPKDYQNTQYFTTNNQINKSQTDFTYKPQTKSNEDPLTQKLSLKKEKIRSLKAELENLRSENEMLKNQLNNSNNVNSNTNEYESLFEEMNFKIKTLEEANAQKDNRIKELEDIKSQEIELMNQKIREFEIILDKNANDYLSDINALKTQLEEYQMKLKEQQKHLDEVHFFIHKMNTLIGAEQRDITNSNELQNKFIEIEKFFIKGNQRERYENKNIDQNIQIPHFQNKVLEEEVGVNLENFSDANKDSSNDIIGDEIYKKLEKRIKVLEKENSLMNNQFNQKGKKNELKLARNNSKIDNKIGTLKEEGGKKMKIMPIRSKSIGRFQRNLSKEKNYNSTQNTTDTKVKKKMKKIKKKVTNTKSEKAQSEVSFVSQRIKGVNNKKYKDK